jgi:hypothetical protein
VDVSGNYAYVADDYVGGLRIIDISNPVNPIEVGYYNTPGYARDVEVSGDYAFVAAETHGLWIINCANPNAPYPVGNIGTYDYTYGVGVSGNYAYMAEYNYGLRIIDVSNPANPSQAGYYDTPGHAMDVTVSGNFACVADDDGGIRIIDVSNPSNPFETGYYDTPGEGRGVAVSGEYAYVADGFYFEIFDCSQALRITNLNALISLSKFILYPPDPNPFNAETKITFSLPFAGEISLKVFNITGAEIETIYQGYSCAGYYEMAFNGFNLPSGVYFIYLQTGSINRTQKIMLVK